MQNNKYWIKRAEKRMIDYMDNAERVSSEIAKAYADSTLYIQHETENIFKNFVGVVGVSEAEAKRMLKHIKSDNLLTDMRKAIQTVKDPKLKAEMLAQLNAPAYRARIERLKALQSNIEKECNRIYKTQLQTSTDALKGTINSAYYRTMFDIQQGTGYGFTFAKMPVSRINEILKNKWSGNDYSVRIWRSTARLKEELKAELLKGFMSGKSNQKMADIIAERMNVGSFDAHRLIRTETCYVANQAELESYKECGIEKYEFVATLDSRTSEVCQDYDGKIIPIDKAVPGENIPPLHPFCRSTTIAVIDGATEDGLKRRARDKKGKPILVDKSMKYAEWKKIYGG